jgi:hypothetical protein
MPRPLSAAAVVLKGAFKTPDSHGGRVRRRDAPKGTFETWPDRGDQYISGRELPGGGGFGRCAPEAREAGPDYELARFADGAISEGRAIKNQHISGHPAMP